VRGHAISHGLVVSLARVHVGDVLTKADEQLFVVLTVQEESTPAVHGAHAREG
jgi:hypothetical protein